MLKALGDIISILRHAKDKESSYKGRSPSPPVVVETPPPSRKPKTAAGKSQTTKPQTAGPRIPLTTTTTAKTKAAKTVGASVKVSTKAPPQPAQLKVVTTQKVAGDSSSQKRASTGSIGNMRVTDSKSTTVLNASSALSTSRPGRLKLSERFNEYETEVKRKKLSEGDTTVSAAQLKEIRLTNQTAVKSRQQQEGAGVAMKQTITGPTLVGDSSSKAGSDVKYIGVKVGDKIKLKAVPRQQSRTSQAQEGGAKNNGANGAESSSSRRTQFTVQVPSKQPGVVETKSPPAEKTVKTKPQVTVVPAQGKALNRAKPLTSIFDRLDAPSSSTTAISLLKKDEGRKDNNVFKRLGTKTDGEGDDVRSSKTPIAVGVVRPAAASTPVSSRLGEKTNSESVFSRLGSQSI